MEDKEHLQCNETFIAPTNFTPNLPPPKEREREREIEEIIEEEDFPPYSPIKAAIYCASKLVFPDAIKIEINKVDDVFLVKILNIYSKKSITNFILPNEFIKDKAIRHEKLKNHFKFLAEKDVYKRLKNKKRKIDSKKND